MAMRWMPPPSKLHAACLVSHVTQAGILKVTLIGYLGHISTHDEAWRWPGNSVVLIDVILNHSSQAIDSMTSSNVWWRQFEVDKSDGRRKGHRWCRHEVPAHFTLYSSRMLGTLCGSAFSLFLRLEKDVSKLLKKKELRIHMKLLMSVFACK